jgi:hypothetical protein
VWFDIVSESSMIDVLRMNNASGAPIDYLYVTQSRVLAMSANGTKIVSPATVTTRRFHEIELALTVNGATSTTQVWLDGKLVPALSRTSNLGTLPIAQVQVGQAQSGGIYDVVFDDAAFDTTFLP